jgi:cellulose synthase operon protein C
MYLRAIAQVALSAAIAAWIVGGRPVPTLTFAVDPMTTGAIAPAGAPQPPRRSAPGIVVGQASEPETAAPQDTQLTAPVTGAPERDQTKVDESALRYFARQGDTRRLNAEIARLKALYPGWQPPADPTAPEVFTDPELDRMWQLFSEGHYADVRSAIAKRRASEPNWEPPPALVDLLDQADTRIRLTNASDAGQWNAVIDTAAKAPSLLTCDYVDILWRVAEAFAKTDRPNRAEDAYTYILTNCDKPEERLATIQKAMDLLPASDVDALLRLDRGGEFQTAKDELIRRRVGAIAENETSVADPTDLVRLASLAAEPQDAADALLLGWYDYRHGEPGKAVDWFAKARDRDPASAKAAEGYTLALIGLDRFAEAETAGYDWNEKSAENLAAYVAAVVKLLGADPPVKISEAVLGRIVSVVVRVKSPEAGEQLGWYAYNLGQVKTAAQWFTTVLKWAPDYEPAAYGLIVTQLALNQRTAANEMIRAWRDRSERIAKLARPVKGELRGPQYAVDAAIYDSPDSSGTAAAAPSASASRCSGSAPVNTLAPDAALRRGWCLMDLNRPVEAAAAFAIALRSASAATRSDAAYGASLANLRSGVTDKAAIAASAAPLAPDRQVELTVSILTQQALAAYADGRYAEAILALDERNRYAPEQNDLLVLRGYAYLKSRRYADAKRIFEAAAGTGLPDAVRGLAEVQALQNGVR